MKFAMHERNIPVTNESEYSTKLQEKLAKMANKAQEVNRAQTPKKKETAPSDYVALSIRPVITENGMQYQFVRLTLDRETNTVVSVDELTAPDGFSESREKLEIAAATYLFPEW